MKPLCVGALAVLVFSIAPAFAGNLENAGDTIAKLPYDKCDFREVVGRLQAAAIDRAAQIAKEVLPVLDEEERIDSKAKIANKPIGEQLSLADNETLSRLSQRLITLQMMSLIESRRERDLAVMLTWAQQIDANIRWGTEPKQGTTEYKEWALFMLTRMGLDKEIRITAPEKQCSIQTAIARLEDEPMKEFNKIPLNQAFSQLSQLAEKYNERPIDPATLSTGDKRVYDSAIMVVAPGEKFRDGVMEYETLKILATASDLIHQWDLQDVIDTAGDAAAVGRTVAKFENDKSSPETLKVAFEVWRKLNDIVPSDVGKMVRELSKVVKAAQKR